MIRCNTEQDFIKLMLHIFFSSGRAKLEYDEILDLEYEFVQSALGRGKDPLSASTINHNRNVEKSQSHESTISPIKSNDFAFL